MKRRHSGAIEVDIEAELSVRESGRSGDLRLPFNEVVRPEGLEPPTLGSEGRQSTLETDSDQGGQMDMFSL
ncbi:MAG: hypothetical protein NTNFB01_14100 [Nitrospira sp.]